MYLHMKVVNVANAVIVDPEGRLLLTQRFEPAIPQIHLKWQIPGGKIERNESPAEACIREAKEETGLNVEIISNQTLRIEQLYPDNKFYLNVFLTSPVSGTINTSLDHETHDARWFTVEEIANLNCLDNTQEMVDFAVKIWKKH